MGIKQIARRSAWFVLTASILTTVSCSGLKSIYKGSSTNSKNATIKAEPNPVRVCDGSGVGVTKLTWASAGTSRVEVHVSSPDGALFAQTAPSGTGETGKWVTEGMTFYLQDVSGGKSLTAENTLATETVKVTTDGCH